MWVDVVKLLICELICDIFVLFLFFIMLIFLVFKFVICDFKFFKFFLVNFNLCLGFIFILIVFSFCNDFNLLYVDLVFFCIWFNVVDNLFLVVKIIVILV